MAARGLDRRRVENSSLVRDALPVRSRLHSYPHIVVDEQGTVLSPADIGMPDGHPTTTEVQVELEAVDGGTKMVMTHHGIPVGSPGAAGWAMAFSKLDARVEAHVNQVNQ